MGSLCSPMNVDQQLMEQRMSNQQIDLKNEHDEHDHQDTKTIYEIDELEKNKSIQNIIAALRYYQIILNNANYNNLISKYFDENKTILQDYITILKQYLDNTVQLNDAIFEQIHDIISKQIKCNISNCKQYLRNNRNRQNENDNNESNEFRVLFYTDLMDTIHCYFMH